ncbi:protein FAM122A-like [Acanthaster planci]|uniref:Protein FAM122A-like n=1 Tax=Acanthaster planci TaxID=133434 RepID=A0A8B7Y479_ACAPL|nr:protein FAM122A-like [Acanthaster planci]
MGDKDSICCHGESADEGQMEIERVMSPSGDSQSRLEDNRETGILRRSNSAPMFDGPTMSDESPVFQPIRERQRVRRFSANMSGNAKTANASTPVRVPSRIRQIQQEESLDVRSREAEHEREVQSAFQISHSCDEMSLGESIKALRSDGKTFSEPLRILTSSLPIPSTPSPNRDRTPGKQCFSPSMQISMRSNSLTPSPIPSPTRQTSRVRSMSPVLKPSLLNLKRKYDSDSDSTPPKRQLLSSPSHNSSSQSICSLSSDDASPPQRNLADPSASLAIPVSTSGAVFAFAMGDTHL